MKIIITEQQLKKLTKKIKCKKCDWSWDLKDGGDDPYVCHKCGSDNKNVIYEDKFGSVETTDFIESNVLNEAEYQDDNLPQAKDLWVSDLKIYS